jgi:hypothetical protein
MMDKKRKVLLILGGVILFIGVVAAAIAIAYAVQPKEATPEGENGTVQQDPDESVATPELQPIQAAETLKSEGRAALDKREYDQAMTKYAEGKALYDKAGDTGRASEFEMLIEIAANEKEASANVVNEEVLVGTGN